MKINTNKNNLLKNFKKDQNRHKLNTLLIQN